ncbi:hypothetical protein [Pseudophaeobacter sp.]|uniref:hypothetical protein n=1 Tax=Pseudophaeobacter sp. TaxID=1971739 RepID=UPI004058454C
MQENLETSILQNLLKENSAILNDIRNRAGTLPSSALVEFGCEMPDKSSALSARQELLTQLPPNDDRQIYVFSADGEVECRIDEVVNISPEAISEIEVIILSICQKHGGGDVFWGFEDE